MSIPRRTLLLALAASVVAPLTAARAQSPVKYVRYASGSAVAWGVLEGETIRELRGDLFTSPRPTGKRVRLADVRLLAPVTPSKVIAVGLNYKSHLGERPSAAYPGLFAKLPTSIIGHEENIVLPSDAKNAHYEGEMVIVIGSRTSNVSVADAPSHIFGITAGNDVSERDWQKDDLQWFRAKASDTFGPLGPAIVTGLRPAPPDAPQRRRRPVTAHEGPDLQRRRDRELREPVRDAAAGRRDLHRDTGVDETDSPR